MRNKIYVITENNKTLGFNFGKQGIYWNYKSAINKLERLRELYPKKEYKMLVYRLFGVE